MCGLDTTRWGSSWRSRRRRARRLGSSAWAKRALCRTLPGSNHASRPASSMSRSVSLVSGCRAYCTRARGDWWGGWSVRRTCSATWVGNALPVPLCYRKMIAAHLFLAARSTPSAADHYSESPASSPQARGAMPPPDATVPTFLGHLYRCAGCPCPLGAAHPAHRQARGAGARRKRSNLSDNSLICGRGVDDLLHGIYIYV